MGKLTVQRQAFCERVSRDGGVVYRTFTAELVAALTRQGKMPTLWQSMYVPGAEARNERIGKSMFEPDFQIQPIPPGILGRQYVTAVQGFLESIRSQELPRFHEAGALCAETISRGGKVVAWLIGETMAHLSTGDLQ